MTGLTFWFEAVLKLMKDPEPMDCCMVWEADAIIQTMHRATHSLLHKVQLPTPILNLLVLRACLDSLRAGSTVLSQSPWVTSIDKQGRSPTVRELKQPAATSV